MACYKAQEIKDGQTQKIYEIRPEKCKKSTAIRVIMMENAGKGDWKMPKKRCIIPLPWYARIGIVLGVAVSVLAAVLLLRGNESAPQMALSPNDEARSAYDVMLRLNPSVHTVTVAETLDYVNDTGETLSNLVLRTWLNAFATEEHSPSALDEIFDLCYPEGFSPGSLTLYEVTWNGKAASWQYTDDAQTVLEIAIDALAPGERGQLSLRATAKIPNCVYRTGYWDDTYVLSNVVPLLSRYEQGDWRRDAYHPIGDPFLNDCADFSVTVYAPAGYLPVCSAPLEQGEDGAWRGKIAAAREIGLCIGKAYQHQTALQDGTRIDVYCPDAAAARRILKTAQSALSVFSELYGPYPRANYTLCTAAFPFGGMEYSGFCLLSEDFISETYAEMLEWAIAHETAHQWFYDLVGSDTCKAPWQDEALAEYASLRYIQKRYGQNSFATLKFFRVDSAMQARVFGELTPGSPIDYFSHLDDYDIVVYGRGTALLLALDEFLPGGVDAFLRAYCAEFAYKTATRADFEAFLAAYSGMDVQPLLLDYLDTLIVS